MRFPIFNTVSIFVKMENSCLSSSHENILLGPYQPDFKSYLPSKP